MRVQFNGRIPAFQAGCVGSIPITRSICADSSAGQSICLLSRGSGVRVPLSAPLLRERFEQGFQIQVKNIWWDQLSWLKRQFVALETIGSNPIFHPIGNSAEAQRRLGGVFLIKLHIGVSSSGKTQHFDCCIRRFESCHPSQCPEYDKCLGLTYYLLPLHYYLKITWGFGK